MKITWRVILFISVLILPLNLICLFVSTKAVDGAVEQILMAQQGIADVQVENLDMRMKNAHSLLYYLETQDENCIQMIRQDQSADYEVAKMKFYNGFKILVNMTDGADGYFFNLQKAGEILYIGTDSSMPHLREFVENLQPKNRSAGWKLYTVNGNRYMFYTFWRDQAICGAWINLEKITTQVRSSIPHNNPTVMFTEDVTQWEDENLLTITSGGNGFYLCISQERSDILRDIAPIQTVLYAVSISYLAAIPLLYLFLNNLLIKPLKRMNAAHKIVEQGRLEYRIEEGRCAMEYREVFSSFNRMVEKLKNYKIEFYEKELDRQKIELRNQQLQIRPHFLLNIFNLIQMLAVNKKVEEIQTVVMYLADYFRYIVRTEQDLVPLQKELDLIDGYLAVANIRYNGSIKAQIQMDAGLEDTLIPPLLIHNFVENAVKHGLTNERELHIWLNCHLHDGKVVFRIADDGLGMTPEILQRNRQVLSGEVKLEGQKQHIGLFNSHKRLHLFFKEESAITVESEKDQGTRFTIEMPRLRGEKDESFDRK